MLNVKPVLPNFFQGVLHIYQTHQLNIREFINDERTENVESIATFRKSGHNITNRTVGKPFFRYNKNHADKPRTLSARQKFIR